MAKYRKRPLVIEAVQFDPGQPWPECIIPLPDTPTTNGYIRTLEGDMVVNPGDWVITGVKGENYSCKDDVFRMTYEAVEG